MHFVEVITCLYCIFKFCCNPCLANLYKLWIYMVEYSLCKSNRLTLLLLHSISSLCSTASCVFLCIDIVEKAKVRLTPWIRVQCYYKVGNPCN